MAGDSRNDVIKKALSDPKFKADLLKDPKVAIEKATGVKVPPGVTIKIVEDSASTVHLVLPPSVSKGALSEGDLSKVSGGAGGWTTPGQCANACTDSHC